MATKVPSDYEAAAALFYSTGRANARSGYPREGAYDPNDPVWDQSYKLDAALRSGPLVTEFGPVEFHYWWGHDDQKNQWPDRGWRYSLNTLGRHGASRRSRIENLRWLYTQAWTGRLLPAYKAGDLPDAEKFLTSREVQWVLEQGASDRKVSNPAPDGYREPKDAGIPGIDDKPAAPAEPNPRYQGFNWRASVNFDRDAGNGGGFANILPLLFMGRGRGGRRTARR